jgi:hypothetical protein
MADHLFEMHRRDATEDFDTTVAITRPDSAGVTWVGGEYVATQIAVYTGGCRLRSQGSSAVLVQAGDKPVTLRTYDVDVPPSVTVLIDDLVVVTASADPVAVGLRLRVIDVPKTEWVSVRHLVAVEES